MPNHKNKAEKQCSILTNQDTLFSYLEYNVVNNRRIAFALNQYNEEINVHYREHRSTFIMSPS
jgi:hypothetical protein